MVQIQIDISDKELLRKLEIYKAENIFKSKQEAIIKILNDKFYPNKKKGFHLNLQDVDKTIGEMS